MSDDFDKRQARINRLKKKKAAESDESVQLKDALVTDTFLFEEAPAEISSPPFTETVGRPGRVDRFSAPTKDQESPLEYPVAAAMKKRLPPPAEAPEDKSKLTFGPPKKEPPIPTATKTPTPTTYTYTAKERKEDERALFRPRYFTLTGLKEIIAENKFVSCLLAAGLAGFIGLGTYSYFSGEKDNKKYDQVAAVAPVDTTPDAGLEEKVDEEESEEIIFETRDVLDDDQPISDSKGDSDYTIKLTKIPDAEKLKGGNATPSIEDTQKKSGIDKAFDALAKTQEELTIPQASTSIPQTPTNIPQAPTKISLAPTLEKVVAIGKLKDLTTRKTEPPKVEEPLLTLKEAYGLEGSYLCSKKGQMFLGQDVYEFERGTYKVKRKNGQKVLVYDSHRTGKCTPRKLKLEDVESNGECYISGEKYYFVFRYDYEGFREGNAHQLSSLSLQWVLPGEKEISRSTKVDCFALSTPLPIKDYGAYGTCYRITFGTKVPRRKHNTFVFDSHELRDHGFRKDLHYKVNDKGRILHTILRRGFIASQKEAPECKMTLRREINNVNYGGIAPLDSPIRGE